MDSDKIYIIQFSDSFHTTDLQFLSSGISMNLRGAGGSTCKPYMIPCSLIGMSKYCCVKCPLAICCILLTEGHLSQRQRPRILRLMSLLTLLVSGLNIYAALWQILLCCVVLWYGMWHGIAYCIFGMISCIVFYVVWKRVVKSAYNVL